MGTGASKTHSVEKQKARDNEEKATVIQNGSASTLPDITPIRQKLEQPNKEDEEISEDIEKMVQTIQSHRENEQGQSGIQGAVETEDVSLSFESFQHNNGTLYTCFIQNGIRMYFDDEMGIVPFPEELYSQGKFIYSHNESDKMPDDVRQDSYGNSGYLENDRTCSFYIPGKGMVMTYLFEERINICKYYDSEAGAWLILPLLWEMNVDFILQRVEQVKEALPAITDYKEILAALRLCNYNPDEAISMFFAMFGDSLENTINGEQNFEPTVFKRDIDQKEKKIESLTRDLQERERELESLRLKCKYLEDEKHHLNHRTKSLHEKVSELQSEHEKYIKEINESMTKNVPVTNPLQTYSPVNKDILQKLLREARELNVTNEQLRVLATSGLSDLGLCMDRLHGTVNNMQSSTKELGEIRALYQRESMERKLLYNQLQELRGNIRVFCRSRLDNGKGEHLEFPSDEEILVNQNGNKKRFRFDQVFRPQCTQEEVFEQTLPIIKSCVDGYNVCILAYGQTGSGKTYTMMGNEQKPGVNIRSIRELLRICHERERTKYTTKISMLEIYNESVWDLLSQNGNKQLEIRSQGKNVTVPGLTEAVVLTEEDIKNTISFGEKNRTVASTKMNTESSRSHLMVILTVNGIDSISGVLSNATLTLCDLAGSERISKTEATGQRLVEAASINKSLTSLGQVFAALKKNSLHVPYRNSKLTHLLQPSLSGQAKACVFVNISPDIKDLGETVSSLQFGSSIQQIALGNPTPHTSSVKLGN
ncbi:kinesin-like protein klp-3 [Pseudophryne corroboree]|uniref:kinesin-like protein klp-3 n=1 Tax=Pseudophryne corroboree TaxID=495146 RepID=UPI0030814B55